MKKIISVLLVSVMVLSAMCSFGAFSQAANISSEFVTVGLDSGDVYFSEDYAEIGKEISACIDGHDGEKLFYKWFIDNEQIDNFGSSYTPCDTDLERIMTVEIYDDNCDLIGKRSMLISPLPVVYIEVDDRAEIVSKTKTLNAYMRIQGNSLYNDPATLYDGTTEIKGRGNTTWSSSKKPYKLKLDSKTNLFGMGKNKHWVLLSNPYDTSNLRNTLAYDLSGEMGLNNQQTVFVDVVLNGTVIGIYQLCEHVRIDSTRVDIHNWDDAAEDAAKAIYNANKGAMTKDQRDELAEVMTNDLSWTTSDKVTYNGVTYTVSEYYEYPEINGGYLFEIGTDSGALTFKTSHGQNIEVDKPEGISKDMMSYLSKYYNAFEDALYSPDFCTVYNGKKMRYTDFIDVESFAKGVLVNEIFENCDFGKKSTWMSLDFDGKIVYGPVWDMDMSVSGKFNQWNAGLRPWLKKMLSDPFFMNEMRKVYWEYRYTAIADLLKEGGKFDSAYEYIYSSAIRNDEIWGFTPNFRDNAADFHWRLQTKIDWLDHQFETVSTGLKSLVSGTDSVQYINSSDIKLGLSGNTLSVDFAQIPDSVSIFVDGNPVKEITSPKTKNAAVISSLTDNSIISVIGYDENGEVLCGNYIGTENHVKSVTVSKIPAKDAYSAGDKLSESDFELTAVYYDGSVKTVSPSYIYTYSTDSIGIQDYAYEEFTDEKGSISAVLMFENVRVELGLKTKPSEDYAEVMEMIENLPDDVTLQTALRPLFDTVEAYEALSTEAKAKVRNADKLNKAMADFDSYAESSEYAILGGYVDGLFRMDSMNTVVTVVKNKPKKIIFISGTSSTSTHSRTDVDVFGIRKVGNYEIWTLRQMLRSTVSGYSWRASYAGDIGSVYGESFDHRDYKAESSPINRISYSKSVRVNEACSVNVQTSGIVDTVTVSENGRILKSAKAKADSATEFRIAFSEVGKHTLDISYTINGIETLYDTVNVTVTGEPQAEKELMSVKYDDCSYSKMSDIKVATGKDVSDVYLKASDGTKINLSASEKNGYKVWSADFETGGKYTLVVDGRKLDEPVANVKLGDVNMDGVVNSYDALLVLQFSVNQKIPAEDEAIRSDMNGDGMLNSYDALMILRVVTGELK